MVKEFSYSDRMFDRTIPNSGRTMEDTNVVPEKPQTDEVFRGWKAVLSDGSSSYIDEDGNTVWYQSRAVPMDNETTKVQISGIGKTPKEAQQLRVYIAGSNEYTIITGKYMSVIKLDSKLKSEEQLDHMKLIEDYAQADLLDA